MIKTLNEYMAMPYRMEIVEDKDEGVYMVSFPDLPGCLTCGETVESAVTNAMDAKKAWLKAALEDGIEIPEPDSLENYSGQFKLRIPRSLHRSLAEHSKREGISMNQYCVYLLSTNNAMYMGKQPGIMRHCRGEALAIENKKIKDSNIEAKNLFWYEEFWNDEDLKMALENAEIEITDENVARLKQECLHIFDDKSERKEMLTDMARNIFDRS